MHTEQCPYCRKWVSHKPILGTLHFCMTTEERRAIDHGKWMVEQQIKAQNQYLRSPSEH